MGWGDWAGGGVEIHFVPGNHANLMYEPHVQVLAATLIGLPRRAQVATEAAGRGAGKDRTMTSATVPTPGLPSANQGRRFAFACSVFPLQAAALRSFVAWQMACRPMSRSARFSLPGRGTRAMEKPFSSAFASCPGAGRSPCPSSRQAPLPSSVIASEHWSAFGLARQLRRRSAVQPVGLLRFRGSRTAAPSSGPANPCTA